LKFFYENGIPNRSPKAFSNSPARASAFPAQPATERTKRQWMSGRSLMEEEGNERIAIFVSYKPYFFGLRQKMRRRLNSMSNLYRINIKHLLFSL
jgi:hypothetical protein